MKFYVVLLTFLVVGCSTAANTPALPGTLEGVATSVRVDPKLFEGCTKPSPLIENPRPSDVLEQRARDVAYEDCLISRNASLAKAVKKLSNLE